MKVNTREEKLKLLADLSSFYSSYHNQKETAAWLGSALYIGVIAQIGIAAMNWRSPSPPLKVGVCLFVVALMALVLRLVVLQLGLRAIGQNRLEATIRLRSIITSYEPPRILWRLQPLRRWSHEEVKEVHP